MANVRVGALVAAVGLICCHVVFGSTILIRAAGEHVPEPVAVETFGGTLNLTRTIIHPATSLVVVWAVDSFDQAMLAQARSNLLSLIDQNRSRSIRLAALRGQSITITALTSKADAERVISSTSLPNRTAGIDAAQKPAALGWPNDFGWLDSLVKNSEQLGAGWSPVVLEGKLPAPGSAGDTYAESLLQRAFTTTKLRVFKIESDDKSKWKTLFESTGGADVETVDQLALAMDEASQNFLEVSWVSAALPGGYVVVTSTVQDFKARVIAKVPDIVSGIEALPTIKAEAEFEKALMEVQTLLSVPASDESMRTARALLADGQKTNPLDPRLLQAETLYCEQGNATEEAVKAAVLLTQVEPNDGAAWALRGHAEFLTGDLEKAKAALDHAAALNIPNELIAADYARIDLANKNWKEALSYLLKATSADTKQPDLWLLQGQTAEQLDNRSLAIQSYEKAVAFHEPSGQAATALIRLYILNDERMKASQLAAETIDALPPDFSVRLLFAQSLEDEKMAAQAKAAWKSLLRVKPRDAESCERAARSMLKAGNAEDASELAAIGVHDFPKSVALYLVWTDALLQQARLSEARSNLENGAKETNDPVLLSRLAKMQEGYPDRAEESYRKLAEVLPASSSERHNALKRGYVIAIRDGELDAARQFASYLEGKDSKHVELPFNEVAAPSGAGLVPGGLEGLAIVAHMSSGMNSKRFFTEYARTLTSHVCRTNCAGAPYANEIGAYFESVKRLESLGKRDGNHVAITLGWNNEEERRVTSETVGILGLEVRSMKGKITLEHSRSKIGNLDLQGMPGFDQLSLEDAMRAGKTFSFEVIDQEAPIAGGEKRWMDAFGKQQSDSFALLLLNSPEAARLYVGLSSMDPMSLNVLLTSASLKDLAANSADALAMYSSCLEVEDGHAVVPGGVKAEPIWQRLFGISPADPGAFFAALLHPENAELLGFYFHLSQLDQAHQKFFTDSFARVSDFAKLFVKSQELQGAHRVLTGNSAVADLLRDAPLDDRGHIVFPGSAQLWNHLAHLSTTDAASDEAILTQLSEQHAGAGSGRETELASFLAVTQVDAHRVKPLDEESAQLLAQRYPDFAPLYPYFMDIRSIDSVGFHTLFNLLDRMHKLSVMERNLALGQLYSLIEWDAILSRRREISDEQAAHLFTQICKGFDMDSASGRTLASIAVIEDLLRACSGVTQAKPESFDDSVQACFEGKPLNESTDNLDVADEYKETLLALNAPKLDQLLRIAKIAQSFGNAPQTMDQIALLEHAIKGLPKVPVPSHISSIGYQRESLLLYDTTELQRIADELSRETIAKNENQASLRKLANLLLGALEPQVTLAFAAPIYAHFFRSTDLVVSEDPLLLRKHRYYDFASLAGQNKLVMKSEFVFNTQGAGSYLQGSFAEFGLASAQAASAGLRQGGKGGKGVVADQIAAIRGADWNLLTESDLRLASLRILAAREWIVDAADKPVKLQSLEEATIGLLSFARRAELVQGIEARDWERVWSAVTLPDLFTLGGSKFLPMDGLPDSEVQAELKNVRSKKTEQDLDVLARLPFQTEGCYHPHAVTDAPYEEYEGRADEDDLAARSAEFKLYLAYHADSVGLTPAQTGAIAETLAVRALRASQMNDNHDWRSLLAAYAAISNKDLIDAVGR